MNEFFAIATSMPTLVWSVLAVAVLLYWLTVIFGLFDLEILEGLFGSAEGAAEGAAEGLAGAAEGALEGAVEGAAEAADAVEGGGCLGLAGVPLTIVGSTIVLFGWTFSYGGMKLLAGTALGGLALAGVGVGALVLSLGTASVALRPLKKVFRLPPATARRDLVGKIATVRTLRVDEKFGQAEVEDEGAAILIQARCPQENALTRGSKALVFDYDPRKEVFYVTPLEEKLAEISAQNP